MSREYNQLLVQRSLDGALSAHERDELARALRDDPLLREEAEEMQAVHRATAAMFRQIALPAAFSARVMRRIQPQHVPADEKLASDSLRLPSARHRRDTGRRLRRRGFRVGALVAVLSLAIAAALIIRFADQLPLVRKGQDSSQVGGREGVPRLGGGNRTDPPSPQPETREAPKPSKGDGASQPGARDGQLPGGDRVDSAPTDGGKAAPHADAPAEVNASKGEPGTQVPNPENSSRDGATPPAQGPVVDREPDAAPEGKNTQAQPPNFDRPVLARLNRLGGRVEMLAADGKWQRLNGDEELRQGAQIRTNVNGTAGVLFASSAITLAKSSVITLAGPERVSLESGTLAIDRPLNGAGGSLAVNCDAYVFYMMHGAASIERKRRGVNVQHFVGLSSLTHDTLGSVVFEKSSALDYEFGKEYPAAKNLPGLAVPDWVSDSRAACLMAALEPKLKERAFAERDRSELDRKLPAALGRLLHYALDRGAVFEFMSRALDNRKLDAACLLAMADDLDTALVETKGAVPDNLAIHAACAAMQPATVDIGTWREAFQRFVRGDDGKPFVTTTWRKVTTEAIERGKVRRVDNPPEPGQGGD